MTFDTNVFRLGAMCRKYKHEYLDTGLGLRYAKSGQCVECKKEKSRLFYRENIDHIKEYSAGYRKTTRGIKSMVDGCKRYRKTDNGKQVIRSANKRRRTRLRDNDSKDVYYDWVDVCNTFNGKCAYCGNCGITQDHITPITKGGASKYNNVIPACQTCNVSKHDDDMIIWYSEQPFFSIEALNKIINHIST